MIETIKLLSKKLNASFRIACKIPEGYGISTTRFNCVLLLSNTNELNNSKLKALNDSNVFIFNIYPDKNIEKNKLLYSSYDNDYGFSAIYEDFILNEAMPHLREKFKLNELNDTIITLEETSFLGFSLVESYDTSFKRLVLIDFNPKDDYKRFLNDLKSKFDPSIEFFMTPNTCKEIQEILSMFGCKCFNTSLNLNELNRII